MVFMSSVTAISLKFWNSSLNIIFKPNDNQFNTEGGDNPLKDTDSEGDNEEEHEHPSKRKYSNFIDDEAEEEEPERPIRNTEYAEVLYKDDEQKEPTKRIVWTKKLEQQFELAQSRYASTMPNVKNPYSRKILNRTFHNEGELFYEKLCGNYFIIYVYAKDTGKNMYSLCCKILAIISSKPNPHQRVVVFKSIVSITVGRTYSFFSS